MHQFDEDILDLILESNVIEAEYLTLKTRLVTLESKLAMKRFEISEKLSEVGVKSMEVDGHKVWLQGTGGKLTIYDESKIPHNLFYKEEVVTIDKKTIKKLIEDGHEVPGAMIEPSKETLRIKYKGK